MGDTISELPMDDPMRAAWEVYKTSTEYENSRHWALRVAPMFQAGEGREAVCDLMPLDQRSRHVEGSLWAAFCAGYAAAKAQ